MARVILQLVACLVFAKQEFQCSSSLPATLCDFNVVISLELSNILFEMKIKNNDSR